jgi:hypothetical protein
MSKFPLNLQFFAEENPAATSAAATTTVASAAATTPAPSAKDFASELMKALDERTSRAEKGVLKSMADQYGMSEDEAKAVMEKAKAEKAKALTPDAQKQIDEAKAELLKYKLSAEVAKEGAALGLLDPDVAMTLLGEDATKANDKGEFAGLKAALEKLKESKPYLFGGKPGAMAQRVSGSAPGALSSLEERFYERNPELRPK